MTPPEKLLAYQAAGAISREDIAVAAMLVEMASRCGAANPSLLVWLGTCLALRTVRDGHTCVDLDRIADWAGDIDTEKPERLEWPTDAGSWVTALGACTTLVGTTAEHKQTGKRKPLILDGHRLYLARSLAEEQSIADALRERARTGKLHILLGGPGTGKTTKVAKDLVERFGKLSPGESLPPIALAAPTGKAAAQMTEAVKQACAAAGGSEALLQWISSAPARTIHKLLGFNPKSEKRRFHAGFRGPMRSSGASGSAVDRVSFSCFIVKAGSY